MVNDAWEWLKKYWKWIIFPVGLLLTIAGYISGRLTQRPTVVLPPSPPFQEMEELSRMRDEKLVELKVQHKERLQELSENQQKELEELQERPIEEVTKWFDQL